MYYLLLLVYADLN